MDSFEAFKDAVEAEAEYRNHPTVWGLRPEWVHLPWDRTLNGEERKEEGKIAQRDNDSEVAQALAEETSLAIKEGSADGTIQNAKDAATEAVRQKVSAKPHSVTDIVANLPSMSDQIAEEVLSDQAAQTAKTAATDAVHQKVFAIHELVENILIHLPPKTVFGMQRVCKSFANALRMAPQIREKLHLKRRDTDQRHILHDDMTLNPFFEMDPSLKVSTGSTRATIQMRDQVPINYASSMLDTYLYDIPCGRI